MYRAKEQGGNTCRLFTPSMSAGALEHLTLESALRRALARDEFHLVYQPQVDVATGEVQAVEALCRWTYPERGLVPPAQFIPLAEETGLMPALGRHVLRQACANLRRWQVAGPRWHDLYVSVNLSTQEVHDPDLVATVIEVLAETNVAPENLVLEITEGVLLDSGDEAIDRPTELNQLGVRLAVDDFGTGYSALSYLQRFPMDILKIDKTFIDQLDEQDGQARLVNGIIELARGVNLQTVAEGIETSQQAATLRGMRAGLGQGFHFARPLRPEDVDAVLAPESLAPAGA